VRLLGGLEKNAKKQPNPIPGLIHTSTPHIYLTAEPYPQRSSTPPPPCSARTATRLPQPARRSRVPLAPGTRPPRLAERLPAPMPGPCGAPGTRPPRPRARLGERLAELYEVKDPSCIYNLEASSSSSPSTGSSGYAVLDWPPM
jgi:hypothetical protein